MTHIVPLRNVITSNSNQDFIKYLVVIALMIIFMTTNSLLAGTTGKITGFVTDKSTGETMAGANIYLEGYPYGAASDIDGYYYIINVPPGKYTLIVNLIGYHQIRMENVEVKIDLTTRIDFVVQPEHLELDEAIVVVAERPLIDIDVTSSAVSISADEIKAMPVDNLYQVIENQAGVVAGHFRGGRLGEVAYLVDGIPVNDPYNNSNTVSVENTSIQELEVISGTFNAEYGQAMSGVVNIITKDGRPDRVDATFSGFLGKYYTTDNELFPNLDKLDGGQLQNIQLTVGGPVPLTNKFTFFINGRYFNDDGHLYGQRIYNTSDSNPFLPTGDGEYVRMNYGLYKSFLGKLTYFLSSEIKISYSFLAGFNQNNYYDHAFQLTPDGLIDHYRENYTSNLIFNHTLSTNTFHTIKFTSNETKYKGYLYEDPLDPRYVIPEQGLPQSGYTFRSGGNQTNRYKRIANTWLGKWDLVSQISKAHKLGLGIIYRQHKMDVAGTSFRSRSIGFDPIELQEIYEIVYPEPGTPGYEQYIRKPFEVSAYIQDKMEFEDFIINLGIRFDYFDPASEMLTDIRNPTNNELFPFDNEPTPVKTQISPRFGISFPISSKGVIHVSYGHFFQIPNFEQLYGNIYDRADGTTVFLIDKTGLNTVTGNPDLDAQRTIQYEAGIQQVLYSHLVLDFTAYYRDLRNLIDTEIIETYDQNKYGRFINRDYGNVRGIILSLEKRLSNFWGARLDFTYQYAEGNASDPRTVFFDNQSDPPRESEKKLLRLDWDQRSTLNFTFTAGIPFDWDIGLIGRYGTGTPYTADLRFNPINVDFRNNRTKPVVFSFDLKAEKTFYIASTRLTAFLYIFNLLDTRNEYGVYGSTGRADSDLNTKFAGDVVGIHTIDDYVRNPSMYSAPRQIRLGLAFGI
jgi:outer membrane receptor protein involved in Fe transport